MFRKMELFAARWIRTLVFADRMWKHPAAGVTLIFISWLVFMYWSWRIPSPGKAVAYLAVLAAVMTFRGEVGGMEKFFWMFLLFAFLFIELRAINKDRQDYEREHAASRREENKAFREIAEDIQTSNEQNQQRFEASMKPITQMLEQSGQALANTQPRAVIKIEKTDFPKNPLIAGAKLPFNVFYQNIGNADGKNAIAGAKIYAARLDNAADEGVITQKFEKWWRNEKKGFARSTFIPQDIRFSSFTSDGFSEKEEVEGIKNGALTIYVIERVEYFDDQRHWGTDVCFGYQEPLVDTLVSHGCLSNNRVRYAVKK